MNYDDIDRLNRYLRARRREVGNKLIDLEHDFKTLGKYIDLLEEIEKTLKQLQEKQE